MALLVKKTTSGREYKVKDMRLADSGRFEIELAAVEMPGLMACRAELGPHQPLKGAKITVSLHMITEIALLIETLTALGADVRWCSNNMFSTRDYVAAAIARDSAAVFAWKNETLEEYWWCIERALDWGPDDGGPNLIVDDGGDLTLLILEGAKAEEIYEKTGKLPDPYSTDDAEFQIILRIIRDGLKSDPKRYHKMKETLAGLAGTTGVKRKEFFPELKSLFQKINLCAKNLPQIRLISAWGRSDIGVIEEIGRRKPEVSGEKDLEYGGRTFLRFACIKGDLEMVRNLVALDSKLCLVEDKFSMIPVQTAVINGRSVVIRELVFACPESLEKVTVMNETVFHLAAKNYQDDAFKVLLEEAKKHNKQHLLDEEDYRGNTVLHIAVSNKLIRIVKLLLLDPSSESYTTGIAIRMNATNKKGHTAMDLYYQIPDRTFAVQEIGRILREASRHLEQPRTISNRRRGSSPNLRLMETKNVLLVVLAIFIGLAFTVTCALPALFPRENYIASGVVFRFKDVISGELPLIFYIMAFISILLTISTGMLTALLYSLPWGSLLLLGGVSTFNLYVLLAYYIMPKFYVKVGSHDTSSSRMMWILSLGFIFFGGLLLFLGNSLLLRSYIFAIWLKRKLQV